MKRPPSKSTVALLAAAALIALNGCSVTILGKRFGRAPEVAACNPAKEACLEVLKPDDTTIRPQHRGGTPQAQGPAAEGFVEGKRPEDIDRTSAKEKAAALDTTAGAETELGRTIASLGDVGQQGFWLKTPLVSSEAEGRIVWADNGNTVNVSLLPRDGEGGSQISLAAMRALGIPLTVLAELIVYKK